MSQTPDPRRRIVARPETSESPKTIRHTIALPPRLSGLLAYYAQTRRLTESMVVAQALGQLFRGMRVSDPAHPRAKRKRLRRVCGLTLTHRGKLTYRAPCPARRARSGQGGGV